MTNANRQYYEVIENNDWEGEAWHFFVPLTEVEAKSLRAYVNAAGPAYSMSDEPVSEEEVDECMALEGDTSYLSEYNKCAPLNKTLPETFDPDNDLLYKGGLFKIVEHCFPPPMELD